MTAYRLGLAVAFWLLATDLVRELPTPPPRDMETGEAMSEEDAKLTQLVGEGHTGSAQPLAAERLQALPDSCVAYTLIVESARQSGTLFGVAEQLRLAGIHSPEHRFLPFAQAIAHQYLKDDRRSRDLFELAVRAGSPCAGAYVSFIRIHRKLGRLEEAARVLREVSNARPHDPFLLFASAFLLEVRGEGLRALEAYRRASIIAPPLALTYYHQSGLLMRLGELDEALRLTRTGLGLARRSRATALQIRFLGLAAALFYLNRQDEESRTHFEQALALARHYRLGQFEADLLLDQAGLSSSNGELERWKELVTRAETIPHAHWSSEAQARLLNGLSRASLEVGDHETAAARSARALDLARDADDPFQQMDVELQRAYISMSSGELAGALEASQAVLQRALELSDGYRQGIALSALATIYERMGSYRRSMDYYRLALSWAERDGDRQNQALALGNLALTHMRAGLSAPALVYASRAAELVRQYRHLRLRTTLQQGLAAALAGLGNLEEAARVYERASSAAAELADPELQSLILSGQGRVLLGLGREAAARRSFESALELTAATSNPMVRLQSVSGLGLCYWSEGELKHAAREFRKSLGLVESSRESIRSPSDRLNYLETRSQIYANLSAVLTELDGAKPGAGYDETAFGVVEQSRARTLLDILATTGQDGSIPSARLGEETEPNGERNRAHLEQDELVAEFELGERHSTLWLLNSKRLRWYRLPAQGKIVTAAERLLRSIREPPRFGRNPPTQHRRFARDLFEMLLGPAAAELAEASHLIVSPDGILHHIPFEALLHRSADGSERYLVEDVSVSYIPSLSALSGLRRRAEARSIRESNFLGVAQPAPRLRLSSENPDWQSPDLGTIPFAAEEVEAVGRLFEKEKRRLLAFGETSELAVKQENLSRYRILHFAAHAMADERVPQRSAILLGADAGGREDGILRMGEVLQLSLNADLVVLSGCETGVGQLLRAEGTIGFTWAFLSAGSSSVAVSLWNVNDRSTSEVMKRFYEEMKEGASFAEALAASKRAMLRSSRQAYRHPYYWAPFVLVGLPQGAGWSPSAP